MTNDLLDREPSMEEAPADTPAVPSNSEAPKAPEAPGEEAAAGTGGASTPKERKSVFAPSPRERGGLQARREEQQARKARQESDRQQQAAEREAKKLELQLAREERKARDEERRQEQKLLDEERRRERKAREEEERLYRQEEKANRKTVRRVGTMTLGISLIAIGTAIFLYMVNPSFDLRIVARLAPIILIGLGVETLIRYFFSKDRTYRFDFASGLICILLVLGSFFIALIPELMYYISPQRFAAEEQLVQAERDKIYLAFQGEQRVADYYLYGGVEASLPSAKKDSDGYWVYQLSYLQGNIQLLDSYASEEDFARVCRELMDKLTRAGIFQSNLTLHFYSPENDEGVSYDLWVRNRLQMEMEPENLAKLVDPIFSVPSVENGWMPAGYDDIASEYGVILADHFAYLMEHYDNESASIYYGLLMNDRRPDWAESYFESVTGQEDDFTAGEIPEPSNEEESKPEPEDAPESVEMPEPDSNSVPPIEETASSAA